MTVEPEAQQQGGMLSSTDFLRLVITKDVERQKQFFWRREWEKTGARFIIDPFDPDNLTPFSYDLSVGNEIYSCSTGDVHRLSDASPTYFLKPRETIVVKTKESVALPRNYAATVWPRFRMVTESIFQSMVKIDPTWYGCLGVAITNLSAGDYPIRTGDRFATLILFELKTPTGMYLFSKKEDMPPADGVQLCPDIAKRVSAKIEQDKDLAGACTIQDGKLRLLKLPGWETYGRLLSLIDNDDWQEAVRKCLGAWPKQMDALGMTTLQLIKPTNPKVKRLTRDDVREECTESDLEQAAIEHGRPFHLLPGFHDLLVRTVDTEISPRIRAEVEASLYPKMVTLTLTVLGFLSFVVAAVAFLLDKYKVQSPLTGVDWPGTVAVALITIGVVIFAALLLLLFRKVPEGRAVAKLRKELDVLKRKVAEDGDMHDRG